MKALDNKPETKNRDMKLFVVVMAVLSVALCTTVIINDTVCTDADVEDGYFIYTLNPKSAVCIGYIFMRE